MGLFHNFFLRPGSISNIPIYRQSWRNTVQFSDMPVLCRESVVQLKCNQIFFFVLTATLKTCNCFFSLLMDTTFSVKPIYKSRCCCECQYTNSALSLVFKRYQGRWKWWWGSGVSRVVLCLLKGSPGPIAHNRSFSALHWDHITFHFVIIPRCTKEFSTV